MPKAVSYTHLDVYKRQLFARAGKTVSPVSGREVKKDDVPDVIAAIKNQKEGDKILILSAFKSHANRNMQEELNILLQKGFSRIYEEGTITRIEDLLEQPGTSAAKPNTYILVDRLVKKDFDEDDLHRIADSVSLAFYEGEGTMLLEINGKKKLPFSNKFCLLYSSRCV